MSGDYVQALRTELASLEETGNPRAEQVRAALEAAGERPAEKKAPARRAAGRGRKEDASDKTPKETA